MSITSGETIDLDLPPDSRCVLEAARPSATIAGFVGLLAGRTTKVATLEEIHAATAHGIQATPFTPEAPVRLGEALATLGREIGLTNEDFELVESRFP